MTKQTMLAEEKLVKAHLDEMLEKNLLTLQEWNFLVNTNHRDVLHVYYGEEGMEKFKQLYLTDLSTATKTDSKTEIINNNVTPLHGDYVLGEIRKIDALDVSICKPAQMKDVFTVTLTTNDTNIIENGIKDRRKFDILAVYIPSDRL